MLDYLLNRDGADIAEEILKISDNSEFELLFSSLSMSNIAYITRKVYKGDLLYDELNLIRSFVRITKVDEVSVDSAIALKSVDFEDSLQYMSAKQAGADTLVTNNVKHFPFDDIKICLPSEFVSQCLC